MILHRPALHDLTAIERALDLRGLAVLSEGSDHYILGAADSDVLVRVSKGTRDDSLSREAALLQRLASRVAMPVPIPKPIRLLDEPPCMVMSRVPGVSALEALYELEADPASAITVGEIVGQTLAALHTCDPTEFADLLEVEAYTPEDWHAETTAAAPRLDVLLSPQRRAMLDDFLRQEPPRGTDRYVVSHNDLGVEHVLIEVRNSIGIDVTGIVDWGDAALTDPAYDFGLLLRDLGQPAFDAAVHAYEQRSAPVPGMAQRAAFYAVCTLVEDLLYGIEQQQWAYAGKSLRAWERVLNHQ